MSDLVIGGLVALLGLLGLVASANALDSGMATFGLALFVFAALFDFWLVKKAFDAKE
jgi:hypothetical protein